MVVAEVLYEVLAAQWKRPTSHHHSVSLRLEPKGYDQIEFSLVLAINEMNIHAGLAMRQHVDVEAKP